MGQFVATHDVITVDRQRKYELRVPLVAERCQGVYLIGEAAAEMRSRLRRALPVCASKKYVRNETAPTINKVNELDELTAKTSTEIKDVDARSQKGIEGVNGKVATADQHASDASQRAQAAQQLATTASTKVESLATQVA